MLWFLASCMGPYPLPRDGGGPACDGVLEPGEQVVDGPFDQDGDGWFDGSDPGCARAYAVVDCDDGDPDVHPHAPEIACDGVDDDCDPSTPDAVDADGDGATACVDCDDSDPAVLPGASEACNGIDDDCDGEIDPGCPEFAGFFAVDPPVSYTCAFNTVHIVLDKLHLVWSDPPSAELDNLSGQRPPTMDGTLHENGRFDLEGSVVLGTAGSCDEYYEMQGSFSDEDTFSATFTARFQGAICGGCTKQVLSVTGSRY